MEGGWRGVYKVPGAETLPGEAEGPAGEAAVAAVGAWP